ncbi:MAG: isochorismate synthase [Cyanobacteria bacterium J06626_6]
MSAALSGTEPSNRPSEKDLEMDQIAATADVAAAETRKTLDFLARCQRQAVRENRGKIASITFPIESIAPWVVLSTLGELHQRHFYYDSPQQWALIGIGSVVGCSAAGSSRFDEAQTFIEAWQTQFIYAQTTSKADLAGRFFCSATFFDSPSAKETASASFAPDCFAPVYIFVPRVQVMTLEEGSSITFNILVTATTEIAEVAQCIQVERQRLAMADSLGTVRVAYSGVSSVASSVASSGVIEKDVTSFEGTVVGALSQIAKGTVRKVVLADVMDVAAPQAVDVVRSLQTLRQNHPDCTVFSVGNGRGQSFMGASPERLLSLNEGRLMTDGLAGSASRGETPEEDHVLGQTLLNSDKERHEHQIVVEFIVRQLRSLGLEPQYAQSPHLLRLLHIQHLHTPIIAALNPAQVSPLDVLAKLHPTPAVAGLPLAEACALIRHHESFDRGLYAAPLGWIDTEGNSEFIVGIRSALIDGHRARLYAGAGIVTGSEPGKELAEIRLKLQTLLNALV